MNALLSTDPYGMTGYDFARWLITTYGGWAIAVIVIIVVFANSEKIPIWRNFIDEMIARIIPSKRKKVYAKSFEQSVGRALTKFNLECGSIRNNIVPFNNVKMRWYDSDKDEFQLDGSTAFIYVNDYRSDYQQIVHIISLIVKKSIACQAKYYMPDHMQHASDLMLTRIFVSYTGANALDSFDRDFMPKNFPHIVDLDNIYQRLLKIDKQGLFLTVFLNEVDKLSDKLYPTERTERHINEIIEFINYIYAIANKSQKERASKVYIGTYIKTCILLAHNMVGNAAAFAEDAKIYSTAGIDTFYILGSGRATSVAELIKDEMYNSSWASFDAPIEKRYRRYGLGKRVADAVCFELNVNTFGR